MNIETIFGMGLIIAACVMKLTMIVRIFVIVTGIVIARSMMTHHIMNLFRAIRRRYIDAQNIELGEKLDEYYCCMNYVGIRDEVTGRCSGCNRQHMYYEYNDGNVVELEYHKK